jgi:hypothetical protein
MVWGTSGSSALIRSRASVDGLVPSPWSGSSWRTHSRSVSPKQPILAAINWITVQVEPCSFSSSRASRTARTQFQGKVGVGFVMAQVSEELGELGPLGRLAQFTWPARLTA